MIVKRKEKIRCKILAVALSVCMLLTAQPGLWDGVIVQAAEVVKSGTCGDNLTWTLDADGVLTISGTGAMKDYTDSSNRNPSPFCENNTIKTVVIEKGVTSIGEWRF